jgi:hypothetical protein
MIDLFHRRPDTFNTGVISFHHQSRAFEIVEKDVIAFDDLKRTAPS